MDSQQKLINQLKPEYFWDVDLSKINTANAARFIIERVITLGTIKEIYLVMAYYGEDRVKSIICGIRYLDSKTFNFISKLLNVPKKYFQMLHKESIETATLELIKSLQEKDYLNGFYLVGGTALALHLGHRKSLDIDLFSNFDFDTSVMLENINQIFQYQLFFTAANTLKGVINGINVDILAHRYKYIRKPKVIQGINVLSEEDIIAMKLNAISTSGQRSKDFIDIYYLLEKYDIRNMLDFYLTKYNQQNDAIILKSLIYFDDVDLSDWPVLVRDPKLKWSDVKKKLEKAVLKYAKSQYSK